MAKFIELSLIGTKAKLCVNIDHIQYFEINPKGTQIYLSTPLTNGQPYWLVVEESYKELKKLVSHESIS